MMLYSHGLKGENDGEGTCDIFRFNFMLLNPLMVWIWPIS